MLGKTQPEFARISHIKRGEGGLRFCKSRKTQRQGFEISQQRKHKQPETTQAESWHNQGVIGE